MGLTGVPYDMRHCLQSCHMVRLPSVPYDKGLLEQSYVMGLTGAVHMTLD